jgi:hypothetical protein
MMMHAEIERKRERERERETESERERTTIKNTQPNIGPVEY